MPQQPFHETCLTVDPSYMDPAFNEDGSCIVLDYQKLANDYDLEDLTDNGESEVRVMGIKNWPQYLVRIDIPDWVYEEGNEWEEIEYRAIKEWLPEELKSKVETFENHASLILRRERTDL